LDLARKTTRVALEVHRGEGKGLRTVAIHMPLWPSPSWMRSVRTADQVAIAGTVHKSGERGELDSARGLDDLVGRGSRHV